MESTALVWTLVPEEQVITPEMAAASERPDPPSLPETLPPAAMPTSTRSGRFPLAFPPVSPLILRVSPVSLSLVQPT